MIGFDPGGPDYQRRLLPGGRIAGPMPWVITIMVFLTMLATGAGLGIVAAGNRLGNDLARRVTVQLVEPDLQQRRAQRDAAQRLLAGYRNVAVLRVVPEAEARALVAPWIGGAAAEDSDIPVPALIDLTLAGPADAAAIAELRTRLAAVAPSARVDAQRAWLGPVEALLESIGWVAAGLVALLGVATGSVVVLAARGALNTHAGTIGIVHMMGATDRQITRLFTRRLARDALGGAILGALAGLAVIALLVAQLRRIEGALFQTATLPWPGWLALLLVPAAVVLLAWTVARVTILANLKASL